jgi:hypothetical protein
LGSGTVFLDEWFEYYIAGADADLKLQNIYGEKCELVVVCVSKQYGGKSWTQAEHEAVRARLMQARNSTDKRDRDRILPIRVGEGEVEGIPFNAIVPDVRGSVIRAADLILRRLQHVVPDERVHPQSDTALPPWKDSPPYPGLRAFSFEEAAIFFGRRGETDDLVARLRECQLLAVIGASGTGRSSLVNAGLLPRLATGAIEGSANWRVVNIRLRSQGANPFLALANELLKLRSQDAKDQPALTAEDVAKNLESDPAYIIRFAQDVLEHNESNVVSELILFIDQFEELFTDFARDYHGKFANLLAAAARHNSRIRVIVTLRVDFQSQALQHPQLAELLQKKGATYLLGPPRPTAFNEIIRRPSELAGIQIEDELIDGILDDVNMDPAALPLVAFCLREVYDTDKSSVTGKMTFAAYQRMGGLHKAIGIRSDEALDALEREGVDVNHALDIVFSKLVTIRRNGKAARGRTTLAELHVDRNAEKVASKLIELRLLTCCVVASADGREGAIVELAHDKLLEKWPVLEGWIKANGKYMQILVDLRYAVLDWIRADRKSSFVWKGKRLKDAKIVFRRASLLPSAGDSEVDAGEIKRFIAAIRQKKWINAVAITAAMVAGLVFFPLVIFPSLVPRITMPVGSF